MGTTGNGFGDSFSSGFGGGGKTPTDLPVFQVTEESSQSRLNCYHSITRMYFYKDKSFEFDGMNINRVCIECDSINCLKGVKKWWYSTSSGW